MAEEKKKSETETDCARNINFLSAKLTIGGAIGHLLSNFEKGFKVACPVVVTEYIKKLHHVRVRPIVRYAYINKDNEVSYLDRTEIEVPARQFTHGGFTVEWPYYVGDTGWVIAGDTYLFMENSGKSVLSHDLTDEEQDILKNKPESLYAHEFESGFFISDTWVSNHMNSDTKEYYEAIADDTDNKVYEEKEEEEYVTRYSKTKISSSGLSIFSTIGDDDEYDKYYQKYLERATCGISIESGSIRIATQGKCEYDLENKDTRPNLQDRYKSLDSYVELTTGGIRFSSSRTDIEKRGEKEKTSMTDVVIGEGGIATYRVSKFDKDGDDETNETQSVGMDGSRLSISYNREEGTGKKGTDAYELKKTTFSSSIDKDASDSGNHSVQFGYGDNKVDKEANLTIGNMKYNPTLSMTTEESTVSRNSKPSSWSKSYSDTKKQSITMKSTGIDASIGGHGLPEGGGWNKYAGWDKSKSGFEDIVHIGGDDAQHGNSFETSISIDTQGLNKNNDITISSGKISISSGSGNDWNKASMHATGEAECEITGSVKFNGSVTCPGC